MGQLKKPVVASLIVLLLVGTIVCLPHFRHRWATAPAGPLGHVISRTVLPPAVPGGADRATPLLDRPTAVTDAARCLNALCETGADADSVTQARRLVARLDVTPRPFAAGLDSVLTGVLACRGTGAPTASPPAFPGLPRDLIDRAASACDEKGRRRPGEIVLSFAGDCTFGTVNGDGGPGRFPSVYRRSGRADYPFALMRPWFLNDDLTVVNFECTLTAAVKTADKQWHFKGPARYARIFPAGSVEAAGLANNHSHDYLQSGFNDTVANFREAHVPVFYQGTPYITMIHGVQVILIGDCTVVGENTTRIDGVPQRVIGEIRHCKRPGNIVIVVMHWGSERAPVPFRWQQALGRRFIDAGADAVVGAHPHVVQGIERYRSRYIAYSLGNFAFGGNSHAANPETFVLRLRFCERAGRTSTPDASLVPCRITSVRANAARSRLRNNYQPQPVFGGAAERTVALVLRRSAPLADGVKRLPFLRLP